MEIEAIRNTPQDRVDRNLWGINLDLDEVLENHIRYCTTKENMEQLEQIHAKLTLLSNKLVNHLKE